jgi:mannose-6-phosphate isomerase-like protein (cupin superfamily)
MPDPRDESRDRKRGKPVGLLDRLIRSTAEVGGEILLAILLVLGLSLVMMGVLIVAFPEGTGLIDVYGELVDRQGAPAAPYLTHAEPREDWLALLTRVSRSVRERPDYAVVWRDARSGLHLGNRHTVQTLSRSRAAITFEERSRLQLEENSLVVIKDAERRKGFRRPGASLVLLSGAVRGQLLRTAADHRPLDIVTVGGATQIQAASAEQPTEFNVAVHDDDSTTYAIYSGTAKISSGGKTVVVGPNEWVTVQPDEVPGEARPIPDPPRSETPADRAEILHGVVTPRIELSWSGSSSLSGYRIQIATDTAFEEIVFENTLQAPRFLHGNLDPGLYYWRVSGLEDEVESLFGSTRSFRVTQDLDPPLLEVAIPEETGGTECLVLQGRTEPGVELFIGNEMISTRSDGQFEHTILLARGLNHVVVEAVDAAGNSTFLSQYVNAKY